MIYNETHFNGYLYRLERVEIERALGYQGKAT